MKRAAKTSGHRGKMLSRDSEKQFAGFRVQPAHKFSENPAFAAGIQNQTHGRSDKRVDNLFNRRTGFPGARLAFGKDPRTLQVQRFRAAHQHRLQEGLFRSKMVVNGGKIDGRRGNDSPQRGSRITPFRKMPFGDVEYPLLCIDCAHTCD